MKILHICSNYFPAHGGPQYTMKHLSEKMVNWYKDDVTVATTNSMYGPEMSIYERIIPANEVINQVKVKRFAFNRWHFGLLDFANKISGKLRKKPLPYILMKRKWALDCPAIDAEMDNSSVEVIMATTVHYNFCDYPFWRSKTKNPKPFILYGSIHFHVNWPKESPLIQRSLACDCYIANTEYEKQRLIEYGMQPHKIVTIGTGIDVNEFICSNEVVKNFRDDNQIADSDILIGHVGRLSEGKGVRLLVEAFEELNKQHKNIKLILAGSKTTYSTQLLSSLKQKKLPIILMENFPDAKKVVIMNAIDIFVLGSKGESFGVVFLEAWSCKKPVIATKMGAISSLLSEGSDSLLFEADNPKSLSDKIETLINNPTKRKEFGEKGFEKVITKYSWEIIVEKYREAYEKGINNFKQNLSA